MSRRDELNCEEMIEYDHWIFLIQWQRIEHTWSAFCDLLLEVNDTGTNTTGHDLRLNTPVLITQLLFLDNSLCFKYGWNFFYVEDEARRIYTL